MSGIVEGEGAGALPEGWAWARLGDLAEYVNGRGFKKEEWAKSGRPIIRIQNLTGSSDTFNHFPGALETKHTIRHGDLLVSWAASLGVYIWRGPEAALNQHIFKVLPSIDKLFLRYLIAYKIKPLMSATHGSGMVHVTRNRFAEILVSIPPLTEQHRIVEALEDHLSRLEKSEALLKTSELRLYRLRNALIQSIIDEAKRYGCERLSGLIREPLRNGHSAKATSNPAGIRTLNLTSVTNHDFSDANTKITSADPDRVSQLWLEPGDILIQRSNTPDLVGTSALFSGPPNWAIYPDLLIRVRTNSHLLPEFAALALRSQSVRQYFKGNAKGLAGSMPKIDQETIGNTSLPVPPLHEQKALVARAHEQAGAVKHLTQQISRGRARARSLRASLLHHAFTGRLVPQDPADEPASTLLARIQEERAARAKVKPTRGQRAPVKRAAPTTSPPTARPAPAAAAVPLPANAVQETFDVFQDQGQADIQTQDAAQ